MGALGNLREYHEVSENLKGALHDVSGAPGGLRGSKRLQELQEILGSLKRNFQEASKVLHKVSGTPGDLMGAQKGVSGGLKGVSGSLRGFQMRSGGLRVT